MPPIKSLHQFLNWLDHHPQRGREHYGLERMQQAVALLDHPERTYPTIHITGTSGKGSTSHLIAVMLQASGKTVGLYTSPAFTTPLDRICYQGRPISAVTFMKIVQQLWPIIDQLSLTYFEIFTLVALEYFKQQRVDYAVIEVGLGGRLDATNVIPSTIAVITTIGLDHTEVLGKTRQRIAKEKAGIIKPTTQIAFTGSRLIKQATYVDTKAVHIHQTSLGGTVFSYRRWSKLQLSLVGKYQLHNAALALRVAEYLKLPPAAVRRACRTIRVPGRFSVVHTKPAVIIDGAHNPQKMRAFVSSLKQLTPLKNYQALHLLISVKYTKDAVATLKPLVPLAHTITITGFSDNAPLPRLKKICRTLNAHATIQIIPTQALAWKAFYQKLQPTDLGIVTGSLYLIGDLWPRLTHSMKRR